MQSRERATPCSRGEPKIVGHAGRHRAWTRLTTAQFWSVESVDRPRSTRRKSVGRVAVDPAAARPEHLSFTTRDQAKQPGRVVDVHVHHRELRSTVGYAWDRPSQ